MTNEEYQLIKQKIEEANTQSEMNEMLNQMQEEIGNEKYEEFLAFDKCFYENQEEGSLGYYDCPICKNKGYISKFKRENGKTYFYVENCKCKQTRDIYRNLEKSGITKAMFNNNSLEKYIDSEEWQKRVKRTAEIYIGTINNNWFVISGQSGCGKTMICTAIFKSLLEKGLKSKYMLWKDELPRLKSNAKSFNENAQNEYTKEMDYLKNVDVLYIDDFLKLLPEGYEKTSDLNIAYEIINARYNNSKLITIISSELNKEEINGIDSAICGRINERAGKYWLQVAKQTNRNYRMKEN